MLERKGDLERSKPLADQLKAGPTHWSASGLVWYYLIRGDVEEAADWFEQAIVLRVLGSPMLRTLRQSSRWPALRQAMKLPTTR